MQRAAIVRSTARPANTPVATTAAERAAHAVRTPNAPGAPLPESERRTAERRFGRSFADVRVHANADTARAARGLHASAYTLGNQIAFGAGRFAPATPRGRRLLHHELQHVAQQQSAATTADPQIDPPHSAHERAARQEPHADGRVELAPLPVQGIQCAPEDEQFSLGSGVVDSVGKEAFGETSWPFLKAVFEGFVGGLLTDIKSGRAETAKTRLMQLLKPWRAATFYLGYLVGFVIGLVSPITDLVKGVIGLVRLGISALQWMAKWSLVGIAISQERQQKIARLTEKFGRLMVEFGNALVDFAANPKQTIDKVSDFLDDLMRRALDKARSIGAGAAHSLFDFVERSGDYDLGEGIGKVIGTLVAQVLLLVFSDAIGNVIKEGAALLGKLGEFVAGKAAAAFNWLKGIGIEAIAALRKAIRGGLRLFEGLTNRAIEAFDALVALFTEGASVESAGELAAAGGGRVGPGMLPNMMESRAVPPTPTRTTPTTVAELRTPNVHPSNVAVEPPKARAPADVGAPANTRPAAATAEPARAPEQPIVERAPQPGEPTTANPPRPPSVEELRARAATDPEAAWELWGRYRKMTDAELFQRYVDAADETAGAVIRQRYPSNEAALRKILGSEYRPPHMATAKLRRARAEVWRAELRSGNMTAEERALGFPRSTLATHTEVRAVRQAGLRPGDVLEIHGQYDPCGSCMRAMNDAATATGATVRYWWAGGPPAGVTFPR